MLNTESNVAPEEYPNDAETSGRNSEILLWMRYIVNCPPSLTLPTFVTHKKPNPCKRVETNVAKKEGLMNALMLNLVRGGATVLAEIGIRGLINTMEIDCAGEVSDAKDGEEIARGTDSEQSGNDSPDSEGPRRSKPIQQD